MKFLKALALILLFPSMCFAQLASDTIWEVRTTGDSTNGACYDDGASGTDYSQQNSAQLSVTDAATSGTGVTTLTSATGGFTSAMVGNCVNLSAGTNLTTGYYQITAHTDTNTVTLDRAPDDGVGGVSGATAKVGGASDHPNTIESGIDTGGTIQHLVYLRSGTYNRQGSNTYVLQLTSNANSNNEYIKWIGYDTTRGDEPTGTNRPLLDMASASSHVMISDGAAEGHSFYNIRFANSTSDCIQFQDATTSRYYNVKISDCGGDGFDHTVSSTRQILVNSEISGCTGSAWGGTEIRDHDLIMSYVHDNNGSDYCNNSGCNVICHYSVIESNTSSYGQQADAGDFRVIGCVFYNNTGASSDGFQISNGTSSGQHYPIFHNVSVDNGRYGFNISVDPPVFYFDFNLYSGNGTAGLNGVSAGSNDVTSDPSFTDAANGDFTLQSGSPALDAGFSMINGLTGDYDWNIGLDQDDVSAGGGGTNAAGAISVGF